MKSKFLTLPVSLLLALTLFFVACSKTGPVGPAGATGATGAQGPAGTAGAAGPQGVAGTANVIYSPWLNVTYRPGNADSSAWIATINAPLLTDSILKTGEMKVYFNAGSDSAGSQFIFPLPIEDLFLLGVVINPYFTPQQITLAATGDESSFTDNGNHYFQYRYVLIPGGTASGRYANVVNWNNYAEVKKYLRLKD